MNALPRHIFGLACLSLLISTTVLVLGALVLPITPALWSIPGAFISTLVYHALLILLSNSHNERSKRAYSISSVGGAYALAIVWTGVLAISLTFTLLLSMGKIDPLPGHPRTNPILITTAGFSSLLPIIFTTVGVIFHKERRQEQYREKWKWKIQINSSNWSFGHD